MACKDYDSSNIKAFNFTSNMFSANTKVYLSELPRSKATFELLHIDNLYVRTDLINEVAIEPFMDTRLRLPLHLWLAIGRLQWLFNSKRQKETRFDTTQKIKEFIQTLNNEKGNVLVIGHGFYFFFLKRFLKKEFIGTHKRLLKNGDVIRLEKKIQD